jgi:Type VI secretion system/phage-baseplate injector OB domain
MSEGTHPLLYLGEVTRRDDPDGLGRVRCLIPGVIEPETRWAFPMGAPGAGTAKRGHFEPPAVGSNVMVQFLLGDPDHPYYQTGPWGDPGGVSDVPEGAAVEGDDRQAAVTEDEEWRITRDSRDPAANKRYKVEHKTNGAHVEIDANPLAIKVRIDSGAGPALELRVTGQEITLETGAGPALVLNGAAGTAYLSAGSSPEIGLSGSDTFVGDRGATKKAMIGDDYRADEAALFAALCAGLQAFATACKVAVVEPALGPAALALEGVLLASPVVDSKVRTDATHAGYLSQHVKVQE